MPALWGSRATGTLLTTPDVVPRGTLASPALRRRGRDVGKHGLDARTATIARTGRSLCAAAWSTTQRFLPYRWTRVPGQTLSIFYGYPVETIENWCGSVATPPMRTKPAVADRRPLSRACSCCTGSGQSPGVGWRGWVVKDDSIVDPDGNETTRSLLHNYFRSCSLLDTWRARPARNPAENSTNCWAASFCDA